MYIDIYIHTHTHTHIHIYIYIYMYIYTHLHKSGQTYRCFTYFLSQRPQYGQAWPGSSPNLASPPAKSSWFRLKVLSFGME